MVDIQCVATKKGEKERRSHSGYWFVH